MTSEKKLRGLLPSTYSEVQGIFGGDHFTQIKENLLRKVAVFYMTQKQNVRPGLEIDK